MLWIPSQNIVDSLFMVFFLPLQKKAEEMGSLNFWSLRKKLILIQNFIFSFFS